MGRVFYNNSKPKSDEADKREPDAGESGRTEEMNSTIP